MKLDQATACLETLLNRDIPAYLEGAPGIGKSQVVASVAAKRGADFRDIRLSMFDPVDLRGLPAIVDGLTVWLRPQIWPSDDTRETVLMFDELDRAAPAVQAAAMQIVLDRRIGEHTLPASVRIVAAGNGKTDKVGTNKMPEALANRFCHLAIQPDAEAWRAWASGAGIDPALIGFLAFRPAMIHKVTMLADGISLDSNSHAFPSPRQWQEVNKLMNEPDAIRHALVAGLVGAAPAGEFEAFVRTMRNLPSLAAVLADPMGAAVPSDPSALYAMAAALARKATEANFGAVLTYAARMPREFEVLTAIDASKRTPRLVETAAYVAWAVRNAAVLS